MKRQIAVYGITIGFCSFILATFRTFTKTFEPSSKKCSNLRPKYHTVVLYVNVRTSLSGETAGVRTFRSAFFTRMFERNVDLSRAIGIRERYILQLHQISNG